MRGSTERTTSSAERKAADSAFSSGIRTSLSRVKRPRRTARRRSTGPLPNGFPIRTRQSRPVGEHTPEDLDGGSSLIFVDGVQLLLIIGAGIAISAIAKRRNIEPGMIIVVLAAAASFIPGVPRLELDSELILAVVVPPLLYSATRGASFAAFGANLGPVVTLGVVLVLVTTGVFGVVASWLMPSIGTAAFVLGAVLAPPDTITTVSHGDEIGLPKRVTSILTGESLVNDATALTLFAIAIGAVNGEHTSWGHGALELLRNAFVGIGIGGLFAVATLWLRKRLGNATL